jgi:purine-binding chemotaxis protein CheW
MDILKARKKAAERKQARKKDKPAEAPVVQPRREEQAPPAEAAPVVPMPLAAAPDSVTVLSADEGPAGAAPSGDDVAEAAANELELLTFYLGQEVYAIPVKDVREVLRVRYLTPVPNAAASLLGVISLRGTVLPVMDLCTRLGLAPWSKDEKSRIVVVGTDGEDVGLVVDRVAGVLRIMPEAVKPAPDSLEQDTAFLSGIARKEDKLYILLNLEKVVGA